MTSPRPSRCRDGRPLVLLCLGLANAVACVTSSVEPAIMSIEPKQSYTDKAVRLTIHTSGVRGRLDIDLQAATDTRGNGSAFQLLPEGPPPSRPFRLSSVVWTAENVFAADAPAHLPTGAYTVMVTNPDGRSATSGSGAFESLGDDLTPPKLSLVSPPDHSALLADTQHEIIVAVDDGYGLIAAPTWTTVSGVRVVNSQPWVPDGNAEPPLPQRWKSVFTVPVPANKQPQASFQLSVKVTDGGENYAQINAAFKAVLAPVIEEIFPTGGPLNGGAAFVIRGSNFLSGGRVLFGTDVALDMELLSSDFVVGRVPPHARPESVSITVESLADQKAIVAAGYRYLAPPRLRGIEPASGPTEGEIHVTAKGTDFRDTTRIFVGTGPDDKREMFDCVTVLPPNKVTGCLEAATGAGTVKVWAEDPVTGGSDADAMEFTYVESASGIVSPPSSPACATP